MMFSRRQSEINLYICIFIFYFVAAYLSLKPTPVEADTNDLCIFRGFFKRSWSDGNILRESSTPISATDVKQENFVNSGLPNQCQGENNVISESSPEISTSESDVTFSRSV